MANTKKPLIGLDNFHYAECLSDTADGLSYDTPVAIEGAVTVRVNPNSNIKTLFADDIPYLTATENGELEVEITAADLSQEIEADILGHTITGGVMIDDADDEPIDLAFGFRAKRSSGEYSYIWLLKGKFAKPGMDHESKKDTTNFQLPTLAGKFVARIYDGQFKRSTRTDATDYTTDLGTTWFDAVQGTTADTTAPTLSSSVPSASSTSAHATNAVTLVFSEPIASSTLTAANVLFVNTTSTATVAATTFTKVSATVTVAHGTFSAGATYNMILNTGLTDERGNALAAVNTVRFTVTA